MKAQSTSYSSTPMRVVISALLGLGCFQAAMILLPAADPFGTSLTAMTIERMSCAGLIIAFILWKRRIWRQYSGMRHLLSRFCPMAVAGSLLTSAAGSRLFLQLSAAQAFTVALTGVVLLLCGGAAISWSLPPAPVDGTLPSEQFLLDRLSALVSVLHGNPVQTAASSIFQRNYHEI